MRFRAALAGVKLIPTIAGAFCFHTAKLFQVSFFSALVKLECY